MNTFVKIMCFVPITLVGCSKGASVVETDPDLGYLTTYAVDTKSGLHHGPYTKTDSSGLLMEKGNLSEGQPDGIRELYYADGKVNVRERYKKGKIDDLYEYFFSNGKLQLQGYYVEGAMYGIWKKYTEEGQLEEEVTMINNEEMGPFKEYHPNGLLAAEGTYLHGPFENGRLKLYDESGQLEKEMLCYTGKCYTTWQKE
jgi:antitoxin component YwqK of YwqJK toxin-antitoxin module